MRKLAISALPSMRNVLEHLLSREPVSFEDLGAKSHLPKAKSDFRTRAEMPKAYQRLIEVFNWLLNDYRATVPT